MKFLNHQIASIGSPQIGDKTSFAIALWNEHLCWTGYNCTKRKDVVPNTMQIRFKIGDTIMFEHDFKKQECGVYHNENLLSIIPVKDKYILPALSLYEPGETIKIIKYEFDWLIIANLFN